MNGTSRVCFHPSFVGRKLCVGPNFSTLDRFSEFGHFFSFFLIPRECRAGGTAPAEIGSEEANAEKQLTCLRGRGRAYDRYRAELLTGSRALSTDTFLKPHYRFHRSHIFFFFEQILPFRMTDDHPRIFQGY